jgi:hypothetical protein
MVRLVLQDKFGCNIKKYRSHISGLGVRVLLTSGPDGIRTFPPHQVFGFFVSPRPRQVLWNAGVTFYAII